MQDYQLSPYDPGSRLHGLYAGGEFAADIWYQPTTFSMISINGTVASIGLMGLLRVVLGSLRAVRPHVRLKPVPRQSGAAISRVSTRRACHGLAHGHARVVRWQRQDGYVRPPQRPLLPPRRQRAVLSDCGFQTACSNKIADYANPPCGRPLAALMGDSTMVSTWTS